MPWPCSSLTAARALVGDSKSTNPYPLHLLVALSRIALVEIIGPNLNIGEVLKDPGLLLILLLTEVDQVLVSGVRAESPNVEVGSGQRLSVLAMARRWPATPIEPGREACHSSCQARQERRPSCACIPWPAWARGEELSGGRAQVVHQGGRSRGVFTHHAQAWTSWLLPGGLTQQN